MPRVMHVGRRLVGLLVVTLLASLVGCPEFGYKMNEGLVGLNCRPAVVQQYGSCVAMKGGKP